MSSSAKSETYYQIEYLSVSGDWIKTSDEFDKLEDCVSYLKSGEFDPTDRIVRYDVVKTLSYDSEGKPIDKDLTI